MNRNITLKSTCAALCLALSLVLPLLTGQIPQIGNMLCPMHIPVFLCGFICGWPWGFSVGLLAPVLRSLIFSMPPMYPTAAAMSFELAAYGLVSGLMYKLLPKKTPYIYVSLITSMVCGRIVWGIARLIFAGIGKTEFPFSVFISGAVTNAIPGIILHIALIPPVIAALRKSKVIKDITA